jgi:hypothetical protein
MSQNGREQDGAVTRLFVGGVHQIGDAARATREEAKIKTMGYASTFLIAGTLFLCTVLGLAVADTGDQGNNFLRIPPPMTEPSVPIATPSQPILPEQGIPNICFPGVSNIQSAAANIPEGSNWTVMDPKGGTVTCTKIGGNIVTSNR